MDIMELMTNPLTQSGKPEHFLRYVLALSASFGMPPQVVATLDDVAALMGLYDPLPANQAKIMVGPLSRWRTDRMQPTMDRINDLERLAYMQRALNAFGGGRPGHMVGTAEIVVAMGNTYRDATPDEHMAVFDWAATDAMSFITGMSKDEIRKGHKWKAIEDAEVLQPGGKYHEAYVTMATAIRRQAIAAVEGDKAEQPRAMLEPLAAHFVHVSERRIALAKRHPEKFGEIVPVLENQLTKIHHMFPNAMKLARSLTEMDPSFYEAADRHFEAEAARV